ncbi:MAG: hypothetical protein JJE35_03775 [Thermoleophilia bacterium]|nr:hypothetical protein [Thermoleophilia bacterium]
MRGRARSTLGIATALAVLFGCASLASAELTARGDLFIKFEGGIAPRALPRTARAPISVSVAGTVRTLSGERPPALRKISIAINRGGRLDTHGLPICHRNEIEPSTTAQALAICGDALVGTGSYDADLAFPEQSAFPTRGRILAFNAIEGGKRAILAHVYGTSPIPIARIIVFHVRETAGTYGTTITGYLPASENRYGYLKRISLSLHRVFTYRGKRRSYLSAACEAPPGFPGAAFPFARVSMAFADRRALSSVLTRSCKVRAAIRP